MAVRVIQTCCSPTLCPCSVMQRATAWLENHATGCFPDGKGLSRRGEQLCHQILTGAAQNNSCETIISRIGKISRHIFRQTIHRKQFFHESAGSALGGKNVDKNTFFQTILSSFIFWRRQKIIPLIQKQFFDPTILFFYHIPTPGRKNSFRKELFFQTPCIPNLE